ncbi:MAG: outer membrane beta-barrel protein [Steroidobacteraceae bacterium]
MLRHLTLTALLLAIAPLSQAADNGIYLGAGYAQSEYGLDNPLNAAEFDDEDSGYKLIVGFRPLDHFGVEANYIDHGDATVPAGVACIQVVGAPCPDTSRFNAKTISAFAVGYIDFPVIDLFAKVGATAWQFDGRSTQAFPEFDIDENDVDLAWGLGVQARFFSLAARLEYENFQIIEDEELGTISLSFTYTFL